MITSFFFIKIGLFTSVHEFLRVLLGKGYNICTLWHQNIRVNRIVLVCSTRKIQLVPHRFRIITSIYFKNFIVVPSTHDIFENIDGATSTVLFS